VRIGAFGRSSTETYFSKDDHIPERLLCLVIGGLNIGILEEGEEAIVFPVAIQKSKPESFSLLFGKLAGGDRVES